MDFIGQPACPICGTIMADIPNGYICQECNTAWSPNVHLEPHVAIRFDGPSIHGGN